jgi:flagellar basal body-associated protein FliL
MAANAPKPATEPAKDNPPASKPSNEAKSGGGQSWMPLIIAIVLMPVLSFATTKFFLLPKLQQPADSGKSASGSSSHKASSTSAASSGGHGAKAAKSHGSGSKDTKEKKASVPLKKVLVNVRDTQGTRFLLANFVLIGATEEFKEIANDQQDQIVDVVSAALANKTIGDLEKPGARTLIKTELMTIINSALGDDLVQDIYFTEFVVQ